MSLQTATLRKITPFYKRITRFQHRSVIYKIENSLVNIRTATTKAGERYWFDVTPELYKHGLVDFFMYTCGTPEVIYIFPRAVFSRFIAKASLGGQKQVPNFTIFVSTNEFEPAGMAHNKYDISVYRNRFSQIK